MFLAWKEIKYSKARYALIIGVLILVSYLVYFLTGLAFGLAQDNKTSVDKWDAQAIVLTEESNANINMSMMSNDLIDDINADEIAELGQTSTVLTNENSESDDNKISAVIFGINPDQFIQPNIIEGANFDEDFEVVADISLKEEHGIQIGDQLPIAGNDEEVTIVGFTDNAKFNVAPVLYTSLDTYQNVRFEGGNNFEEERVSAFVIRDDAIDNIDVSNDDLAIYQINDYINEIPGYTAQVLTFGIMIIFLIIIAAVVIGIFIYVLTVQKTNIFGVMKAQGISSFYIGQSVLGQTLILAVLGVGLGLLLTIMTSWVLPSSVPFALNIYFILIITVLIVLFALIGAIFSVRTVAKIDPLEAIG